VIRVSSGVTVSGPAASAKRSSASSSTFSLPGAADSARSSATVAVSSMSGLEALLSLQEAEDPVERKKRAIKRGHSLLDSLDQLKAALLAGTVPASSLQSIIESLRNRSPSHDPLLDEILEHIELRAEVELAKLGVSSR
jgi:hypothetical protein